MRQNSKSKQEHAGNIKYGTSEAGLGSLHFMLLTAVVISEFSGQFKQYDAFL